MGDGGCIPNLGQTTLNLPDTTIIGDVRSIFQFAAVTRPLVSVGKICDEGHTVTFSDVLFVVHSKRGEETCKFHRTSSGLYVAKLRLRSPAGSAGVGSEQPAQLPIRPVSESTQRTSGLGAVVGRAERLPVDSSDDDAFLCGACR